MPSPAPPPSPNALGNAVAHFEASISAVSPQVLVEFATLREHFNVQTHRLIDLLAPHARLTVALAHATFDSASVSALHGVWKSWQVDAEQLYNSLGAAGLVSRQFLDLLRQLSDTGVSYVDALTALRRARASRKENKDKRSRVSVHRDWVPSDIVDAAKYLNVTLRPPRKRRRHDSTTASPPGPKRDRRSATPLAQGPDHSNSESGEAADGGNHGDARELGHNYGGAQKPRDIHGGTQERAHSHSGSPEPGEGNMEISGDESDARSIEHARATRPWLEDEDDDFTGLGGIGGLVSDEDPIDDNSTADDIGLPTPSSPQLPDVTAAVESQVHPTSSERSSVPIFSPAAPTAPPPPRIPGARQRAALSTHKDAGDTRPWDAELTRPMFDQLADGTWLGNTAIFSLLRLAAPSHVHIIDLGSRESFDHLPQYRLHSWQTTVIVPMHLKRWQHWVLLHLDTVEFRAHLYDSKQSLGACEGMARAASAVAKAAGMDWKERAWRFELQDTPQQTGVDDCGLYALITGLYLSVGETLNQALNAAAWRLILRCFVQGAPRDATDIALSLDLARCGPADTDEPELIQRHRQHSSACLPEQKKQAADATAELGKLKKYITEMEDEEHRGGESS
ncbi:hypothetical protein UCRNP2_10183 [Neofusicoccum parvum UCRNP2]|uniref:Ubiquitin-like protease family profile domain-containing protein n=1 Tax=Botryosphaeria parva (strain UCR-NP2) TaxID=1287680 RepID=R1E6T7_BOTPV|nr:hypothetical protein UCRNP2_10183 [Neofusicoccum parvum UCRNP2]